MDVTNIQHMKLSENTNSTFKKVSLLLSFSLFFEFSDYSKCKYHKVYLMALLLSRAP